MGRVSIWTECSSQLKKIMSTRCRSHWLSEVCLDVGGTRDICWINTHRKGLFVSQFLGRFLGISVFRTFFLCCSSESHLSESLRSSRWWPNPTDMSYLFWHFCAIWNPVFGKFTLSFKFCFIYCHPGSHGQSWCCCCWTSDWLQLSLGSIPGNEVPSAVCPSQNGGGERKRETGREGDNIPVSSNFSCSPFTSFLGTLLMLILHEVLSLVSF